MDAFHAFDRLRRLQGAVVLQAHALRGHAMVVAETLVPQPLTKASVMGPIEDAFALLGAAGATTWSITVAEDGTKRLVATRCLPKAAEQAQQDTRHTQAA